MIVDFNSYVGDFWPGREIADGDPAAVRASLVRIGFDAAFVALMEGPWFRDEQVGNRKLSEVISSHRDFFLPLACIDPTAAYWKEDLDECLGELGFAGIRLYPQYHHYALSDKRVVELCDLAGDRGCPVFITMLVEEDRFAHPAITAARTPADGLFALLANAAKTTFVVNMAGAHQIEPTLSNWDAEPGRVFFDTTRMDKDTLSIDEIVKSAGVGWFVIGTNAPFFYPEGAVMNLGFRTIGESAIRAITQTNYESSPILSKSVERVVQGSRKENGPTLTSDLIAQDWAAMVGPSYGKLVDCHAHFTYDREVMVGMIDQAKRAGVGRILLNGLGILAGVPFGGGQANSDAGEMESMNKSALDYCREFPEILTFVAYINPRLGEPAVANVEKWVRDHGAVGIKIHGGKEDGSVEKTIDVVRKATEMGVPVLFHCFFRTGGNMPAEISPIDMVEIAKAVPDSTVIAGHFGGDWIRATRTIKPYPNVHVDTSGCTHRSGFTEFAVRELGAERILFGSDMWARAFGTQIAKITAAQITEREKALILHGNQERVFGLRS